MKDGLPWKAGLQTEVTQVFAQASHALPLEGPAAHKTSTTCSNQLLKDASPLKTTDCNTNRPTQWQHKQMNTTATQTGQHNGDTNRPTQQQHKQTNTMATQTDQHNSNTQTNTMATQTDQHNGNTNRPTQWQHKQSNTTATQTDQHNL